MLPRIICGDIFWIIIALFIPPLGVFTQVGLTQPFWINLVIYLFAGGGIEQCRLLGAADVWPVEHQPITHTGGTKATAIAVPAIELTAPGLTLA